MVSDAPDGVSIRVATPEDRVAVGRVLEGALLEIADLDEPLADGEVLVATTGEAVVGAVVGAVVVAREGPVDRSPPADWPDATHVRSIAVRRKRRRTGIGTALLRAALERWSPLVADFEADVEGFYAAMGAECRVMPDGRHWTLVRAE